MAGTLALVPGGLESLGSALLGLELMMPPCLAGKDLNLCLGDSLGAVSLTSALALSLLLFLSLILLPRPLALTLTGASSSPLSSFISRMAALASAGRLASSDSTSLVKVSLFSTGSLAVFSRALRASLAWDSSRTLVDVSMTGASVVLGFLLILLRRARFLKSLLP